MTGRALGLGTVGTLALLGAFLFWRWLDSEELGCGLHWYGTDAQLVCAPTMVSFGLWCEAQWGFVRLGYPPAGYCIWIR